MKKWLSKIFRSKRWESPTDGAPALRGPLQRFQQSVALSPEKNEAGECPAGPKKIPKIVPEEELFATTYYEFPGNFTTNLKDSKKFLQISLGVSTQYDEQVMVNVESHQLALRSEILGVMSEFSPEDISGRDGKEQLSIMLKDGINRVLEGVEGFGGVENVHFTSFVLQ